MINILHHTHTPTANQTGMSVCIECVQVQGWPNHQTHRTHTHTHTLAPAFFNVCASASAIILIRYYRWLFALFDRHTHTHTSTSSTYSYVCAGLERTDGENAFATQCSVLAYLFCVYPRSRSSHKSYANANRNAPTCARSIWINVENNTKKNSPQMQSTSNSRCRYPLVTIAATRTVKESARTHSLAIRFRCAHRCTGLYISIHTHAYTHTTGRASRLDLGTCTTTLRPNGFSTNTCVSCSGISFQIHRSHRACS